MKKDKHQLGQQTLAVHSGYSPERSEGSLKVPLFATSTFVAESAEELAHWFEQAYGLNSEPCVPDGLFYSRVANPNLEICEQRLASFESSESAVLFSSGMSAIQTAFFTFLKPGDTVMFSEPVYGGTDYLLRNILPAWGVRTVGFPIHTKKNDFKRLLQKTDDVRVVYMESPCNPTLLLAEVPGITKYSHEHNEDIVVMVDNTILGPIIQKVLCFGVDLSIYSATKSIGGHCDLNAGLILGSRHKISKLKAMRTIFGNMASPHTAWLLTRSIDTLRIRTKEAISSAMKVATFLHKHKNINKVLYPGFEQPKVQMSRARKQCNYIGYSGGSLLSFCVKGGQDEAYKVLNALNVIKLAVSLGGTQSLAEHPRTHTHADVPIEDQNKFGISPSMIRLSVGQENVRDIIYDLSQALNQI